MIFFIERFIINIKTILYKRTRDGIEINTQNNSRKYVIFKLGRQSTLRVITAFSNQLVSIYLV